MIKSELVHRISDQKPQLHGREVEKVVNTVLDEIAAALARSDRVELRGFGVFAIKLRQARRGRNPRSGATVSVPERQSHSLRPASQCTNASTRVESARVPKPIPNRHSRPANLPATSLHSPTNEVCLSPNARDEPPTDPRGVIRIATSSSFRPEHGTSGEPAALTGFAREAPLRAKRLIPFLSVPMRATWRAHRAQATAPIPGPKARTARSVRVSNCRRNLTRM